MNILDHIGAAREQLGTQARSYGATALDTARRSALRTAQRLTATQSRVRTLAAAGQRLTSVSNRYFEQMIGQQAHTIGGLIDEGAERLNRAAKAASLQDLVESQKTLWKTGRERLGKDLRASWKITRESGRELRDLTAETLAALAKAPKTAPVARRTRRAAKAPARARKKA